MLPKVDSAFLRDFLALLPACTGEMSAYHILRQAEDYAVIAVTLVQPGQQLILKLAGPQATLRPDFARSAAIVRLVRARSNLRTFDVLAVDETCQRWPWQYLVTSALPGMTWAEFRQHNAQRLPFAALGTIVAQLQAISFPGCGSITATGTVQDGTDYFRALQTRARQRIARPEHVEMFLTVLQEHRALFDNLQTGTLSHEDLNPFNLLVHETAPGQLTLAVLDFDSAWAGCSESDLARLELWQGMIGPGFWSAYHAQAQLSQAYPPRRPIYQLLWCLEYARPTAQHLRDTANVCAELHLPPITF